MDEGGTAAAVSHAAAICAYLCRTCTVEVTDASRKLRRITLDGGIVLDGPIRTPSAFALLFQGQRLVSLTYYDLII